MAVSAGFYVSENWLLADKYKNRLQVVEMTFYINVGSNKIRQAK
jgi:hypothetical protein